MPAKNGYTNFTKVTADELDAVVLKQNGTAIGSGTGDVAGPSSSVDSEIALFSGTGGKTIKRAATTGVLKAASGVLSAAVAGTDYQAPGGDLKVGSDGTVITKILKGTVNLDMVSLAGSAQSLTFTLTGAAVGDVIIMNPRATLIGASAPNTLIGWTARVSAANTVTLEYAGSNDNASFNPAAADWDYVLFKS